VRRFPPAGSATDHRVQRYYDPGTGQFMSLDPLNQMTNAGYSFVKDNPFGGTDPSGRLFAPANGGGCILRNGGTAPESGTNPCVSTNQLQAVRPSVCVGILAGNGIQVNQSSDLCGPPERSFTQAIGGAAVSLSHVLTRAWNDTGGVAVHAIKTHTIGLCLNTAAGFGLFGTAIGCVAFSGGHFTFIGTVGGGGSSPTASLTLGLLISNATQPSDLRGPFAGAGGSVDAGYSFGDDFSVGNGNANQSIWENEFTAGAGIDPIPIPIPFEYHGDVTNTWTWSP
jgi:hypothetical protein